MTLVVRNHFSQIVFFTRADLEDESIVDIRDGGVIKHRNARIPRNSKIIITSRSDKIARLGTTPPLRLQLLPKEAYWYFFKVCTFGSMDASEHPEIASVAMELAMESERSFMVANVFGRLLRSNTNTLYWRLVLASLREFKKKIRVVLLGGADQPQGRFDALGWKSQIAPNYSYTYSCEIQRPMCIVSR
ncbi:hypothetical protein OsI_24680 [Oryza sativa Indica Group]|uniref:Uncharacterized protein n=1 Tax=Oryza sativa subsp. indica TaxID=39946 RepID=B8B6S7_ORYSI|nr:hypothetical protein OsI_24680 [Oryza sativa Indica Group]